MVHHAKTPASATTDRGQADDEDRSVDMDQPSQPPATAIEPQYCCHCGRLTRDAVIVARAFSPSGVGTAIYACAKDAPRYGKGEGQS